mmetsp:Transcript_12858/g.27242  ORF Transcript_12858/g.27242 Transcript_12858/m.27242 type:complete len:119 (+) Transcript_12858:244-600(+)
MYNIVEKIYRSEHSARTNTRMRYNIDMHADAFLIDDRHKGKDYCHNTNWEQMIPGQLFAYIMFRTKREGKSIQSWIRFALQDFLSKSLDETKTFTTSSGKFFDANPGLKFTPQRRNHK